MLQAFHNDQAVKDKYLNRVIAHVKSKELEVKFKQLRTVCLEVK